METSPPELTTPLWRPSAERIERADFTRYVRWLAQTKGLEFDGYESVWRWSVDEIERFWESVLQYTGVMLHSPYSCVLERRVMPGAKWFPGATLNYAEHTLAWATKPGYADRAAIVFQSELCPRREISWSELAAETGSVTRALESLGVRTGDRVVSYMPNIPQTVVALLAVASLGAIWSSCSPDMGPVSVLDRFRQIEPKVLFAVDGYRYGGKDFDRRSVVADLIERLPSLEAVVFVPYLDAGAAFSPPSLEDGRSVRVVRYPDAIATPAEPRCVPVAFDAPLWIVYSSGTTGMPKPIVHGHGGTVLEGLKGNRLHLDVGPDDRFYWFSSTNWIMWNLWVTSLQTGCTALQFDGNPGWPDLGTMWRFAERERATFFGTSPAFIALCMKAGLDPARDFDLSCLRAVGATGSPLTQEAYQWIYAHVHPDVLLASISGGTDPGAAFLGASPVLPVYAGEMQCRTLGSATYAFDDAGKPMIGEVGELTVTQPMPSMPLYFWGDADGRRYFDSYFDVYPGCWRHGDWLKLIERPESTTSIIFGRSDSTINRHGIRMGTSELYRVVEDFDEVADALVVDLEYLGRESFMALFVVLRPAGKVGSAPVAGYIGPASDGASAARGATGIDPQLRARLLDALRVKLSARHVPNEVYAIPEVPRTMSGKKLEVPVKKILLGQPVDKSANRDSMANPASLDWFIAFAAARNV